MHYFLTLMLTNTMAYKRTRSSRYSRSTKRARRSYVPRRKYVRTARRNPISFITRTAQWSSVVGNGTSYGVGAVFKLSDLPNYTEISNLFDQFSIRRIQYRWLVNIDPMAVTGTKTYPRIHWVHDFDSSGTPSGADELNQYSKKREVYMTDNRPITPWYTLKPSVLAETYQTVSSSYSPKWRQWITSTESGTPHYGIRSYVENLMTGVTLIMEVKYSVWCRNPK